MSLFQQNRKSGSYDKNVHFQWFNGFDKVTDIHNLLPPQHQSVIEKNNELVQVKTVTI